MSRFPVSAPLALCFVWATLVYGGAYDDSSNRGSISAKDHVVVTEFVGNAETFQGRLLWRDERDLKEKGGVQWESDTSQMPADESKEERETQSIQRRCSSPEVLEDSEESPEEDESNLSEVVDKILEHIVGHTDGESDPENMRMRANAAQRRMGEADPLMVTIESEFVKDADGHRTGNLSEDSMLSEVEDTTANVSQVTVLEGARVRLVCNVTGVQHYWVEWRRAANLTFPGGAEVVGGRSVLLDYVGREDAGLYSCTARTTLGHTHSNAVTLNVHYAPVVGLWVRDVANGEVELGCLAEGLPRPNISWYNNSTRISSDCTGNQIVTSTILSPGFLLSIVRIYNVSNKDFAYYHCRAANMQGITRGFAMLHDGTGQLNLGQLKIHKEEYVTPVENPRLASFMLGMVPPLYIALYIIAYLGCYKTSVSGVPGVHGRFGANYDLE